LRRGYGRDGARCGVAAGSRREVAENQEADDGDTGEAPGDGDSEAEATALPRAAAALAVGEIWSRIAATDELAFVGFVVATERRTPHGM